MKRIRLLILLGVVAAALVVPTVAKATGGGGGTPANQVTIQAHADYDAAGTRIDLGLYVRCTGGTGVVTAQINQSPPETPYPVGVGFGPQNVVCDGHSHTVAVTNTGFGFDAGRAWATADLTTASGGSAHAERWVTIIVV